ncbi:MAG: trigger factor [Planctomycetota bacterium]
MSETATETEFTPNVTIEDAGPSQKTLKIEIPADMVDQKLAGTLDTLVAEAQLPGFRKGKAPKQLVQKKFGKMIASQARTEAVSAAYQKAVEEHELKVIGDPIAEQFEELELEPGKAAEIEINVEVMPEFELPALEGLELYRPEIEVTDEMVEKEMEKVCVNEGTLEEREAPEAGDYLTGNGVMTGPDGEEFYNIEGCVVRVPQKQDGGKGMILGVMVDDFEKQLGSPKPGETVTINTSGPENHEREELRGKDLTITFTPSRVDRIVARDADEIAKEYGLDGKDAMAELIRSRLQQQVFVQQQTLVHRQVANHLLESAEMELPERLTASQAERTLERRRMELLYRGVDAQTIESKMAELRSASSVAASRDLKLFFILETAAEKLEVSVDEGEINGRIAQIAVQRGERPEQLRKQIIEQNQVGSIYRQIREHKTMDAIIKASTVTDLPTDEYNAKVKKTSGDDVTTDAVVED